LQTRLDQRGPDDIRRYQVHLIEERKLGVGTVVSYIAALRFFYLKTLQRPAMKEDLPYPNRQRLRLLTILSPEEVSRLIDSARNLLRYRQPILAQLPAAESVLRAIQRCRTPALGGHLDQCAFTRGRSRVSLVIVSTR
jgi:integrase